MAMYDQYEAYRPNLSLAEANELHNADMQALLMDAKVGRPDSELVRKVEGGYINRDGEFVANPVVKVHMDIALKYAAEQLDGWQPVVMPEDDSITLRFPGISPVGKYCAADMLFAQRIARIEAALETRTPEVAAYAKGLLDLRKSNNLNMLNIMTGLEYQMSMSRQMDRASKLCHDPNGRRLLHSTSRQMETEGMVRDYDLYLQGIEHAVGIDPRPELPAEVRDFYRDTLGRELDPELHSKAHETVFIPQTIHVEFENLDDKLLHKAFVNPLNWGKSRSEVEATLSQGQAQRQAVGLGDEEIDNTVAPYARATADRVLHPLFDGLERTSDPKLAISRGDYIIVDGKTVREKMTDEYLAAHGNMAGFDAYYTARVRQQTNEYVAAALMAGKRVEAFVPDRFGHISAEPVQITKTGYEPSPLRKVTLNAWERFFAKRGFYKEKVAQAAEYQRLEEARNRVRQRSLHNAIDFDFGSEYMRRAFFSDWSRANGGRRTPVYDHQVAPGHIYSIGRTAEVSLAVCVMAAQGYAPEDILDPTKLQAERQRVGAEVMHRYEMYDHRWIASAIFHGHRALTAYLDNAVQNGKLHVEDESALFRDENRPLFAVAKTIFDVSQELKGDTRSLYEEAAERSLAPQEVAGLTDAQKKAKAKELAKQLDDRANAVPQFFDFAAKSLDARIEMADGKLEARHFPQRMGDIATFEVLRRGYGTALWGKDSHAAPTDGFTYQKGKPFTECLDYTQLLPVTFAAGSATSAYVGRTDMASRLAAEPGLAREFSNDLANGQLQKRFSFKINTVDFGQSTFRIDPPETPAAQHWQQNERNAPTAGGAGGRAR